jgi:hypothetical protein
LSRPSLISKAARQAGEAFPEKGIRKIGLQKRGYPVGKVKRLKMFALFQGLYEEAQIKWGTN